MCICMYVYLKFAHVSLFSVYVQLFNRTKLALHQLVYVYIYIYEYVYMYIYIYIYMYVCVCVYMCICTYTSQIYSG